MKLHFHSVWALLPAILVGALLATFACSGGDDADPAVATPAPSATAGAQGICLPNETRQPVRAACEDMAEQLGADPGEIELTSAEEQQWPNACLGADEEDEACAEVITPGFIVTLRLSSVGTRYTYHTDMGTNVRLVNIDLAASGAPSGPLGEAEIVVRGREPVAFDFAPDGRLFYTERQLGEIRTVDANATDATSDLWVHVPTFRGSECGLLGLAVDPAFETNGYIYVYVTQPVEGRSDVGKPRVIRYTDSGGTGGEPRVLVDDLPLTNPTNCAHVSGNIHFGPDGFLYVSVGNFEEPTTAADLSVLPGKILRLNAADGSAAPGNPFEGRAGTDPRVFAYGLRNPFDFAFDTQGRMYAPDNGPGNCDELNVIVAGTDYGVPASLPPKEVESCLGLGGVDPIYLFALEGTAPEDFPSNVAPAGVAFLNSASYPTLGTGLLVCEFMPQELRLLKLADAEPQTVAEDVLVSSDCGFNTEVYNGTIYFSNGQGIFRIPTEAP